MIHSSIRSLFLSSVLALAFTFVLPHGGYEGGFEFGPRAATADLIQCMTSCIKHEGGNSAANKATCKSRCANVPSATGGRAAKRDSGSRMSAYKDCQSDCGKDKKCKRVCKKALMRCQ